MHFIIESTHGDPSARAWDTSTATAIQRCRLRHWTVRVAASASLPTASVSFLVAATKTVSKYRVPQIRHVVYAAAAAASSPLADFPQNLEATFNPTVNLSSFH